jgi:S1-C subfamily serine protease
VCQGAVIGVNLGILDPSGKGSFSGVGFAIPIDTVRGLVDQILTHGRVRRPSMGITMAPEQVGWPSTGLMYPGGRGGAGPLHGTVGELQQ